MEKLQVRRREGTGKSACKRLRKEGFIPATLYHKGDECINVAINDREFRRVMRGHGESALVELVFDSDHSAEQQAIYKNLQLDAFMKEIVHVDLQGVRKGEEVNMTIPIVATGSPIGVTDEGGVLVKQLTEVSIRCEPRFIVETITVDISTLKIHDTLAIGDVELPEGLKLHGTDEASVVATVIEQAKLEEPTTAEVELGEDGEPIEAAQGEATEGAEATTAEGK